MRSAERGNGGEVAAPSTPPTVPANAVGAVLCVADVTTGATWPVPGAPHPSWRPSWSPDGTYLAFYGCDARDGAAVRLWCWRLGGGEARALSGEPIFPHAFAADTPRWSPDGGRLYVPLRPRPEPPATHAPVQGGRAGGSGAESGATVQILRSPPRRADPTPDAAGPTPGAAPFSPRQFRDVGAVDVATGETTRLLSGFPAVAVFPSPDGRLLALVTLGARPDMAQYRFVQELHLLPAAGGTPLLAATELDFGGRGRHEPAWSPNSACLAFVRGGGLWTVTLDGADGPSPPSRVELGGGPDGRLDERHLLWEPQQASGRGGGTRLLAADTDGVLWAIGPLPTALHPTEREGSGASGAVAACRALPLPGGRRPAAVVRRNETSWFVSPDGPSGPLGPDGGSCLVCARDPETVRGEFWRVPLDGAAPELLLADDAAFTASAATPIASGFGDASADGRTVIYAREDEAHPPDFWAADCRLARPCRLTRLNPALDGAALGRTRLIRWRGPRNSDCRGTLLVPPIPPDPPSDHGGGPAPLVVGLYPGLDLADWLRRWDADAGAAVVHPQLLASRGFAVLLPDVPSAGVGVLPPAEELSAVVLGGVEAAVRIGVADPDRLGIMGHSAGATAVNRLLAETTRFGAAVSWSGVANVASHFGQLRVRGDGTPDAYGVHTAEAQCGGPPWAAPERYVATSPVFHLDRVRTPLLLVHGTEDDAVGVEQAGELFVGLRRLGREAVLLRYRGEGHTPGRFSEANRRDVANRVLAWFGEHLAI